MSESALRQLADLLASEQGRAFLAEREIFVDPSEFASRLRPPRSRALVESSAWPGPVEPPDGQRRPVYAAQQQYLDCTGSMLQRMALLEELGRTNGVDPFFLWVDTDLAGSDPLMLRFVWSLPGKLAKVRVSASSNDRSELRFVPVDRDRVAEAVRTLDAYLKQAIPAGRASARAGAEQRLERLRAVALDPRASVQSELNRLLVDFLLEEQAAPHPPAVVVSELLDRGVFRPTLDQYLNEAEAARRVFNEAVDGLRGSGIDPKVKPVPPDYLPLNYTCPGCLRRLRLREQVDGVDHNAVASCSCGRDHRFHLGQRTLSMGELEAAGNWSPDVIVTLLMDDLVSGYVAGSSSAMYQGLVMKEVIERVLQRRRVPILVPSAPPGGEGGEADSLLYRYVMQPTH